MKAHGLTAKNLEISDPAVLKLIDDYTREAGVRNLEREITTICRKVVKKVVVKGRDHRRRSRSRTSEAYLGVPKFRRSAVDREDEIGVAIGMAWTEFGGELLTFEATKVHGKGSFILTGQLGEIMQESAQAAFSYVRAKIFELNIAKDVDQGLRHPHPRPRRRHAQGRALGRDHHRHRHPLAPDRDPGQQEAGP